MRLISPIKKWPIDELINEDGAVDNISKENMDKNTLILAPAVELLKYPSIFFYQFSPIRNLNLHFSV